MKMVFIANGSRNKTLDSFDKQTESTLLINRTREQLATTQEKSIVEREIINRSFKISMIDRLQQANGCSSCGK